MKKLLTVLLISFINPSAFAEFTTEPDLPYEQYLLTISTSLDDMDYKTAVHYSIENPHTGTKTYERAARGTGDEVLAKYDVLIDNIAYDPNQGTPAADMNKVEFIDFTVAENTAQGWVRMGEQAIPALTIALSGESSGHATASWRTRYQVPGSGSRKVSLSFRIPEAFMDGRYEQSAKGPHQGRVRVQLLVNGYPVWFSEAMRVAPNTPNASNEFDINTFGESWNFNTSGEKASAKWVTASLGNYSAGQSLDVTLLYFVEASVGKKCKLAADMYACMGMTVGFKRDNGVIGFPVFKSAPSPSILLGNLP